MEHVSKEEKKKEEPKKPELRHGEVVQHQPGDPIYVAMEQSPSSGKVNIWSKDGCINGTVSKRDSYYKSIGVNIFDDLAGLGEDLEKFEIKSTHGGGKYDRRISGYICFGDDGINLTADMCAGTFELEDAEKLVHNLRRLIATARRRKC
jgi:hypothetical protein